MFGIAAAGRRKRRQLCRRADAIKAQAEEQRVTICLELLNSKVDHADYQATGRRSGSPW